VRPRILLRTHYQAHEPRLIIAAVTHASKPTEGHDEGRVAARLETWARANGFVISTPGATYAVANARQLGVLSSTNRWTALGMSFAFLNQVYPPGTGELTPVLTAPEERLYLKTYLIGAGALPVEFASWLLKHGSVTDDQLRRDAILEKLAVAALGEYLRITTDTRDRTFIRHEKDRLAKIDYAAITKRHKRYPFLTTMRRLRLLEHSARSADDNLIRPDSGGRLAALSRTVPDIESLERLIRTLKLQPLLDLELREYSRGDLPQVDSPLKLLLRAYDFAIRHGMQACALNFLDDVLAATIPTSTLQRSPTAEELLAPWHKALPGEIRFHVDRRGKRAFVLLSERSINHIAAERLS
jgi:hypothetical protein